MKVIDPDWQPMNPPDKLTLPRPVHFFTVTSVREGEDNLGWKFLGKCKPRATCCGSRAELRFPGGSLRVVRIGGITGASIIVTKPQPLPAVPLGTEVWLLETEETDYAALAHGDTSQLPIWGLVSNPVDREYRRQLRANVDGQLDSMPHTTARKLLSDSRSSYPARLMDGSWVVYDLPDGQRVLFLPETGGYTVVTLEDEKSSYKNLGEVLAHINGRI